MHRHKAEMGIVIHIWLVANALMQGISYKKITG